MKIAIYSRKSKYTGKGESIGNQIALCRDYISRNIPEAMDEDIAIFEDEGFSAKNLDRPQFMQMMTAARKAPFDYIVVYRLDRISRNVGDFANLIEELNNMHTAFVCIREQFDTSTPMGRAMMNIAAVFAQLERETIAERVRDNLILLARTGRWLGGVAPLGFRGEKTEITDDVGKKRSAYMLTPIPEEEHTVKLIFEKFLELRSLTKTAVWCIHNYIKTREGAEFRIRAVRDILKNPVYCIADKDSHGYFTSLGSSVCFDIDETDGKRGLMPFRRTSQSGRFQHKTAPDEWIIALGKHRGLISSEQWLRAQDLLKQNAGKSFYRPAKNRVSIFSGLVRCGSCGSIMRPRVNSNKHRNPDGTQSFSYMCELKERSRKAKCEMCNVSGNTLDKLICDEILNIIQPDSGVVKPLDRISEKPSSSADEPRDRLNELNKSVDAKQKMISRLLQTLAKSEDSPAMLDYAKCEIERLDREIKQLQCEISEYCFHESNNTQPSALTESMIQSAADFNKLFSELSTAEKRDFMYEIIDKIVWDGENAHVYFRNAGGK